MKYEEVESGKLYVVNEGGTYATYLIVTNKRKKNFDAIIYLDKWRTIKNELALDWDTKGYIYFKLKETTKKPSKSLIRDIFKLAI